MQKAKRLPAQHQDRQPGVQSAMRPRPRTTPEGYRAAGKLEGKVALVTGGDSGIGRSIAVLYAMEGADVALAYLDEHEDANETVRAVEAEGRRAIAIAGDLGNEDFCEEAVARTVDELGGLDVLVNNAAEQHPQQSIEDITATQLERTFRTNIYSMFFLAKAAVPHMHPGSSIINTTSITAYRGSPKLLDHSATKGAIVAFTRSLAKQLVDRGIRVNGVAPGPIWTPLIPSTFDEAEVESFGEGVPMKRAGQPSEVAPCYVFLASRDASYLTGQVLHPNGGEVVNA